MERDKEAAGRYRNRAAKVRDIANDAGDSRMRIILTGVADDYDQLARDQDEGARNHDAHQNRKRYARGIGNRPG